VVILSKLEPDHENELPHTEANLKTVDFGQSVSIEVHVKMWDGGMFWRTTVHSLIALQRRVAHHIY